MPQHHPLLSQRWLLSGLLLLVSALGSPVESAAQLVMPLRLCGDKETRLVPVVCISEQAATAETPAPPAEPERPVEEPAPVTPDPAGDAAPSEVPAATGDIEAPGHPDELSRAAPAPRSSGRAGLRLIVRPPTGRGLDLLGADLRADISGSRIWLAPRGTPTILFSVTERFLSLGLPADSGFGAPNPTDPARCVSTPAPGEVVIVARKSTAECWRAVLPAPTMASTMSGDGRLVIVALEDGTIRWFAAATGKPLLALVVDASERRARPALPPPSPKSADKRGVVITSLMANEGPAERLKTVEKQWVAWTPSGYYDVSSSGSERLGWELVQGGRVDFFKITLFREHYHRPDLISRVLFVQDEEQALEQVNAESGRAKPTTPLLRILPPVVTVLSPAPMQVARQARILVRFRVRSPSQEPVLEPRILLRSRDAYTRGSVTTEEIKGARRKASAKASAKASGPSEELLFEKEIDLPPEDVTVIVLAGTALSPKNPVEVPIRWGGAAIKGAPPKPKLNLVAVGVSRYREPGLRLNFAAKDATDLTAAFMAQKGLRYQSVESRLLTDEHATREAITKALRWLRETTAANDVAVIFLAGHGVTDVGRGRYAFYPQDFDPGRSDTLLGEELLRTELGEIAGRVVLFLDTCHSGRVDLSRLIDELATNEHRVVVFAASTGRQISSESPRWGNGAFTKSLVEGLYGKADFDIDGRITVSELEHYVSERVQELTEERQVPTSAKPVSVPDFLLANVSLGRRAIRRTWFWGMWGAIGAVAISATVGLSVSLARYVQRPTSYASPTPFVW